MTKAEIERKKAQLLARKDEVRKGAREARKEIEESEKTELGEIERKVAQLEAQTRRLEKEVAAKMAIELGLFLLQKGLDSAPVQAIVKSREFDTFMRGGRAKKRAWFGLPELPPAAAPKAKRKAA